MAYENPTFSGTFPASTGLKQYQVVDITTSGALINPSSIGANCVGVLTSSGTTGSTGRVGSTHSGSVQAVQFYGVAKCLSGSSSIVVGDSVVADVDGRVIVGTTNGGIGIALAAGASTSTTAEVIPVLLQPSISLT